MVYLDLNIRLYSIETTCLAYVTSIGGWCKKKIGGERKQTESTGDLVQAPWSFFFLHPNALWTGIFVKIKPNFLSSRDIALASTLISTCLSTEELLLSGMRVVENTEPAPQGQFETSQLELSLKSHAFEKLVYLHTHSLVRCPAHKYERNIV